VSSRKSGVTNTTTTLLISQLAKQLDEEREARKRLQEELESIKQLSY
jgi:molecular chaperone GrpE (heat shock protein)